MRLNRRQRMQKAPQDREEWQKLYYKHQKQYQRQRLMSIKLLWDGYKLVEVCEKLNCNIKTLERWIDAYLAGGFKQLLSPKKSGRKGSGRLNKQQLRLLKFIILHKTPMDYGKQAYRWTLDLLLQVIEEKWKVVLKKSRLQQILVNDLNLSYQKFHRDYLNADKGLQKNFAQDIHRRIAEAEPDEALIWFDEFSISTRPDTSYGWAEKNTSPTVPSNEKKENAIMVF